jgi:GT2 family glycosyltransferase
MIRNSQADIPQVVVLIVCFNGQSHLAECLNSVLASDDDGISRHVLVVDNGSSDGSAAFLEANFPQVQLLRLPLNRGFAGGNNAGWQHIHERFPNVDYIALLNQDTIVQSGWLAELTGYLEHRPVVAAAQAKVLLWPQKNLINTAGNHSHFLGFGFTSGYGQQQSARFDDVQEIDFPSGAAVMIRARTLRRVGLFDELFFLYLEDADLGWKLRQLGYRIAFVPSAVVWHKYEFQSEYRFYYYLERNRWYLLATYYKTPTLLLLAPAMALMELGQFYFAWRNKALDQKLQACAFFFSYKNLSRLLTRRREAQRRRRIGDRAFLRPFSDTIDFAEIKSHLLQRIGNPLLGTYWRIARRLIVW